ncbi:hypothetical protein BD779DRAFT_114072 [Infundibulicybe gibba]|nr:hypothetical protein BD779DRAFT_114072 [Infundibulicybe gibba]
MTRTRALPSAGTYIRAIAANESRSYTKIMCGILDIAKLTSETSAILLLPSEVMDLCYRPTQRRRGDLRVCSLVCQGWLAWARHHLFSILKLNDYTRRISAQHLLQSPLCTIHPHVHGLKLCIDPSDIAPIVALIQEVNARSTLLLLKMKTATGAGLTLMDDVSKESA